MLITCPECGHQVSDKAPTCPNCGIEIAGKVAPAKSAATAVPVESTRKPSPSPATPPSSDDDSGFSPWVYVISLLMVLFICGVGYYFYSKQTKANDEIAAFEKCTKSNSLSELKDFLDTYRDAPREHRDSVQQLITMINAENRDWSDAVVSNTRSALQHYIDTHPESVHRDEATQMIDSIDFLSAKNANTAEALKSYVEGHPIGKFVEQAHKLMRLLNATIVQPEEKAMLASVFRTFFQSVNAKDEDRLVGTVNSLLSTFLGKRDADKGDVITFMKKLWKEDVENLNWRIIDDYVIEKKEVGDGEYEFAVTFTATQTVEKATGNTNNKYRVKAKVNPDGKISEFNMSKVLE